MTEVEETRGRPQKDPEETYSKQIAIAVSPSQKEIAKLEADRCEVSLTKLVRGVFFNGSLAYARRFGRSEISDVLVSRLDGPEIREHYSEPVPRDFQEILAIAAEIRAKDFRNYQTFEELKSSLDDLESRLFNTFGEFRVQGRKRQKIREKKENKTKTSTIQVRVRRKDWEWIDQINRSCKVLRGNSTFIRRVLFFWIRMNELFSRRKSLSGKILRKLISLKRDDNILEKKGEDLVEQTAEEVKEVPDLVERVQRQRGFRSLRR